MATWNAIAQIAKYFQTDDKFVTVEEFREFWGSLTDAEQYYYRTVDLKTGLRDNEFASPAKAYLGARTGGVREL